MPRSVRLYTPAQFGDVKALVDSIAERSGLPPADRGRLTAFPADLNQTVREDRRRDRPPSRGLELIPHDDTASHSHPLHRVPGRRRRGLHRVRTASNAVLHSASCGEFFTVCAELPPGLRLGRGRRPRRPLAANQPDGRPHGLDVVEALTGPDNWGTETTRGGGRVVWARLDLAAGE